MREVISDATQVGLNICAEGLCSCSECIHEHFCIARGIELLQCQRHRTFVVLGTQNFCSARGTIRSCCHNYSVGSCKVSQVFYFLHYNPSLDQSWGILTLIVISLLLNYDYLTSLCTFKGSNHLNFQTIFLVIFFKTNLLQHMS